MDDPGGRSGSPAAPCTILPIGWMPERSPRRNRCFVKKGETARELWERALAPLGQKLLAEVIDYAKIHKSLPSRPQDEQIRDQRTEPSGISPPFCPSSVRSAALRAKFSLPTGN